MGRQIHLAVLGQYPSLFTRHYTGPMRVVYNLCREWKKASEIELTVLSNTLFGFPLPIGHCYLALLRTRVYRFDLMNIHGISGTGVEIAKLCKKRQIPIIYTAHGAAYKEKELGYDYSEKFLRQEVQLVCLADKVVAVSPELALLLKSKYGLPDEKVTTIYNGIDPAFGLKDFDEVNIRQKYDIPEDHKILLNVGGTRRVKDIPFLTRSLELLKKNEWHLILVGAEGEDHEEIMRECNSKLGNHFTFTSRVPENELLSLYHQADLYIATSQYEGFSQTPLEAMSCGTDVVVRSTMPGAQQYFCNILPLIEKNIFETPTELADIITNYLEGNQKIGTERLQEIIKSHSWEKRAAKYLEVFKELLRA